MRCSEASSSARRNNPEFANHNPERDPSPTRVQKEDWPGASQALNQLPPGSERSLNPQLLRSLGNGLYQSGDYQNAAAVYSSLLDCDPDTGPTVSLKLAAILLEVNSRPKAALRVLKDVNRDELSDRQLRKLHEIEQRSEKLIEEGHIELPGAS